MKAHVLCRFAVQPSGACSPPQPCETPLLSYSSGESKAHCLKNLSTPEHGRETIPGVDGEAVTLFRLLKDFHNEGRKAGFP